MQVPDLELRIEVYTVVVQGAKAVLRFLPLLAHHDDWRLNGSQAGQDEVEQDEGVRVEGPVRPEGIEGDPHAKDRSEPDQEGPTTAIESECVGELLAKRAHLRVVGLDILGHEVTFGETSRHLSIKLCKFPALRPQQVLDVKGAVAVGFATADRCLVGQIGVVLSDARSERWAQVID